VKRGGAAAAIALLALVLACHPRPQRTEIAFWQLWPTATLRPLMAQFEAENPAYAVTLRELDSPGAHDTLLAAAASGKVPDLCELESAWLPRLLATDALSDWSAGVADLRDSVRGWEMCSVGEAVYGLPWLLDARALFFNRTLFRHAGLDSTHGPQSWGDLARDASAVERIGRGIHGVGLRAAGDGRLLEDFMGFAWGNGGEILSAGADSSRFDSPENREALAFYLGLRGAALMAPEHALEREFKEGRLGLLVGRASLLRDVLREEPALRFGVGLMPGPGGRGGTRASYADGHVLASFRGARHKEAALRLARFLLRPVNALALARAAATVEPATRGADTLVSYARFPGRLAFIRQLESARFTPAHAQWDSMSIAIESELGRALEDHRSPTESTAVRTAAAVDRRLTVLIGRR
jgi:multiple sugar transport system substrate-binding protein